MEITIIIIIKKHSLTHSLAHSLTYSIDRSIDQPVNQSINQPLGLNTLAQPTVPLARVAQILTTPEHPPSAFPRPRKYVFVTAGASVEDEEFIISIFSPFRISMPIITPSHTSQENDGCMEIPSTKRKLSRNSSPVSGPSSPKVR